MKRPLGAVVLFTHCTHACMLVASVLLVTISSCSWWQGAPNEIHVHYCVITAPALKGYWMDGQHGNWVNLVLITAINNAIYSLLCFLGCHQSR